MSRPMSDVKLLELPEPALEWPTGIWLRNGSYVQPGNYYTDEQVRACVHTATEALRAEVAEWKRVAAAQAELHGEAEARAERLEGALLHLRNHTSVNSHQIELIDTALHPTAAQEEGRE